MSSTRSQELQSRPDGQYNITENNAETPPFKEPLSGHPKLAHLMSVSSQTAIFRRFGELNMLNLLHLQAELYDMEHRLREIRIEDTHSKDPVRASYGNDFRLMRNWRETRDSLQYDSLVKIGKKLTEYNAALFQTLELRTAKLPTSREIGFLRNWLLRPSMGNDFLNDVEHSIWEVSNTPDLVTLFSRELEKDVLTTFLERGLLNLYHRIWGHRQKQSDSPDPGTEFRSYDERRVMTMSNSVGAILSSLLPTVAILVLYFVNTTLIRIGLIILFTAIFSLALALFTEAKKVEIFSATAAQCWLSPIDNAICADQSHRFAAVEVVFIGSSGTNSTG
ncbi:hypothetical protein MMC11_006663 [Xylographa trunciseda]|nr:hypothetical protein [Xylographa trunciseda]